MKPWIIAVALLAAILPGCGRAPETPQPKYAAAPERHARPVYNFAVHPLHNPEQLFHAYQPLIDYLNRKLPEAHFELEASRDYQVYEAKFRARKPEFLLANPWQTLQAEKVGYHVIAMAGDAEDFKGIFIVRRDSAISTPADLKGKVVSYPSYTALAASIMPQYFLHTHGVDVNRDIENRYVGSQESSIMNAYLKQSAAGATWPPPWRMFERDHPKEAAELKVIWETPSLINNSVMVRDDIPAVLRDKVRRLLTGLKQAPQGKGILEGMQTAEFHPANDAGYEIVRDFVARFEHEVRPVERK